MKYLTVNKLKGHVDANVMCINMIEKTRKFTISNVLNGHKISAMTMDNWNLIYYDASQGL